MTFNYYEFSKLNAARADRWHHGFPHDGIWSGSDWSNAMCGETGEAANVVKKLRRIETNLPGNRGDTPVTLTKQLAEELADAFTYMDLLATFYGIDLPLAVARKFNEVSDRNGFPERIDLE